MATTIRVARDHGHPWTGERGWDMMDIEANTKAELSAAINAAEKKFWVVWISGRNEGNGKPAAALYKPSGATGPWDDEPETT